MKHATRLPGVYKKKVNKKPDTVVMYIAEFMSQGWNKTQATSLAWAEWFETWLARMEMQHQGRINISIRIDCYCKTCKDGGQLLPGTTIMWLGMHKDHDTKTIKIR